MSVPLTCEKCAGEKQNANNAVWKIKYVYFVPGEVKGLVQASWLGNVCNGTHSSFFFITKGSSCFTVTHYNQTLGLQIGADLLYIKTRVTM